MTVIAYRNGVMACDSCWTLNGDDISTLSNKIYRLGGGAILGHSGANDGRALMKLLNKVRTVAQLPSYEAICAIRSEGLGLLVLPSGRFFKIGTTRVAVENWDKDDTNPDDVGLWEIEQDFTAIGTGAPYAKGAMASGADAAQAAEIACRFDVYCRPPIHSERLK